MEIEEDIEAKSRLKINAIGGTEIKRSIGAASHRHLEALHASDPYRCTFSMLSIVKMNMLMMTEGDEAVVPT